MQVVAFFDLDRTLIDVNSAVLYARHERDHKRISNWQLFTTAVYTGLYHFNLLDMNKAYSRAISYYRGLEEETLDSRSREFFHQKVRHRLQPGAQKAIEEHRSKAHLLVLLTSSSSYQARAACEAWGFDDWIANRFPTCKQGKLLGTFQEPLCYGRGKVELAEEWAKDKNVDLDASYFYSDSYSDLAMLERVGYPKVVNPDPKLKSLSKRLNWPVLDWTKA